MSEVHTMWVHQGDKEWWLLGCWEWCRSRTWTSPSPDCALTRPCTNNRRSCSVCLDLRRSTGAAGRGAMIVSTVKLERHGECCRDQWRSTWISRRVDWHRRAWDLESLRRDTSWCTHRSELRICVNITLLACPLTYQSSSRNMRHCRSCWTARWYCASQTRRGHRTRRARECR